MTTKAISSLLGVRANLIECISLLVLLILSALILYTPKRAGNLDFDCAAYAAQSINIAQGKGNTIDMGDERIPGFYPPVYPALTALVHWICGTDIQNGVTANFIMGLLVLALVYLFGRRMAGGIGGALSLLLLLKSEVFQNVCQNIYSQIPSLLIIVLLGMLLIKGWEDGSWAWVFRFSAGLLSGLSILIRSSDVVFAPVMVLFALIAFPPRGNFRLRTAAPLLFGVLISAAIVLFYNHSNYGSPLTTGYMVWGFSMGEQFSLNHNSDPPYRKFNSFNCQLLRSAFGLGEIYPFPVALAALAGGVFAWRLRAIKPCLWRLSIATALLILLLYAFLSLYFFRTPLYTIITTPFVVIMASSAVVIISRWLEVRYSIDRPWISIVVLAAVLIWQYPGVKNAALLQKDQKEAPNYLTLMEDASKKIEKDAIVMGNLDPVLAEYIIVHNTKRRYLYLSRLPYAIFKRIITKELGVYPKMFKELSLSIAKHKKAGQPIEFPDHEKYIEKYKKAGRPIYISSILNTPHPVDRQLVAEVGKFLRKTYHIEMTEVSEFLRIGDRK